jgi:phage major head subunit gpT-like protein
MALDLSNLQAISTGFKALFTETYNSTVSIAASIATEVQSSSLQESYPWIGEIPSMKEWISDRDVKELTDHNYTIKNKKWEATVRVPSENIAYDNVGVFAPAIKMMAVEAKKQGDRLAINMLINGHIGLCYDKKPFFAADHAVGANTVSNLDTLALNSDNLLAAYQQMMSMTNADGVAMGITPETLVVGPKLFGVVKDTIDLDKQGTNRTYKLVNYIVHPSITDSSWYLLDTSKAIKPFILQKAEDGSFEENDQELFMKGAMLYGTKAFMNAGYSMWQLAHKSQVA